MATMAELQRVHFSKEQSGIHAQNELVLSLLTELSSLVALLLSKFENAYIYMYIAMLCYLTSQYTGKSF